MPWTPVGVYMLAAALAGQLLPWRMVNSRVREIVQRGKRTIRKEIGFKTRAPDVDRERMGVNGWVGGCIGVSSLSYFGFGSSENDRSSSGRSEEEEAIDHTSSRTAGRLLS